MASVSDLDPQQTFFCGRHGLLELIRLQPVLEKFTDTLFSEKLLTVNRNSETRKSVKQLNSNIQDFLRLLSPYFLHRSSQKCIQWLMYVFDVHKYNTDALFECVLPYYQSKEFLTLVRTICFKNDSRWCWINQEVNSLSSITFLKHCQKKKWLLMFVCDMMIKSLKTHKRYDCLSKGSLKNVTAFYCSTVVGTITGKKKISSNFLSPLLPFILEGLKSSHEDLKYASMMITGAIGVKVALIHDVLKTLLFILEKIYRKSMLQEAKLCAVLLCTNVFDDDSYPLWCKDMICTEEKIEYVFSSQLESDVKENVDSVNNHSNQLNFITVNGISYPLEELSEVLKHKYVRNLINNDAQMSMNLMHSLIEDIPPPSDASYNLWLDTPMTISSDYSNIYHLFLVCVLKLCVKLNGTDAGESLEQCLYKFHLGGKGAFIRFMAMIWTSVPQQSVITEPLQSHALDVTIAYIKSKDENSLKPLFSPSCPVIPSFLLGLNSLSKSVRNGCIKCMMALYNGVHQVTDECEPYYTFTKEIINKQYEIEADEFTVVVFLQQFFSSLSSNGSKTKKCKVSDSKDNLFEFLVTWFLSLSAVKSRNPPYHVMANFLQLFHQVDNEKKLNLILPVLDFMVGKLQTINEDCVDKAFLDVFKLLLSCYTPTIALSLTKDSEAFNTILDIFAICDTVNNTPCVLMIKQITPKFFKSIKCLDCQKCIFNALIDKMLCSTSSALAVLIKQCLQKLSYKCELIIDQFNGLDSLGVAKNNETASNRKRKMSKAVQPQISFNRVALILEIVRVAFHSIDDCIQLVSLLFRVLTACLNTEMSTEHSLIEFIQLLVVDILCEIYEIHGKSSIGISSYDLFEMEVIIKTLNSSANVPIQRSILHLLSVVFLIFPSQKIHNLMPVFAFIGGSLSRQDNQLTFDVITKTITTIMPQLIKTSEQRYSSSQLDPILCTVTEVFRVLVDSLPYIPHNRTLPLLVLILNVVNPSDYLYVMLGLLVGKCVMDSSECKNTSNGWIDIKFLISISDSFDYSVQIHAIFQLLQYIMVLPQDIPNGQGNVRRILKSRSYLFHGCSPKQFNQFRYAILSLLVGIVCNIEKTCGKISSAENIDSIVCCCLEYLLSVGEIHPDNKYWRAVAKRVCTLSEKVSNLLHLEIFLNISHNLISSTDSIQLSAIKLFNKFIENSSENFLPEEQNSLMKMMEVLGNISVTDSKSVAVKQSALFGMKLIVPKIKSQSKLFIKIARSLVKVLENQSLDSLVKCNTILCLAEMCRCLTVDMIELIPQLLPHLLSSMDFSNHYLSLSCLTSLLAVVKYVPTVASYTVDILQKVCIIENDSAPVVALAKSIRITVAESFSPRIILPAICQIQSLVCNPNQECVYAIIDPFESVIHRLNKEDLKLNIPAITNIFISLLEYRSSCNHILDHGHVLEVENRVNNVFCKIVMKLSEITFKPLFAKIQEWSIKDGLFSDRMITFCHLTSSISKQLKSLFILFASPLVIPFGEIIQACAQKNVDGTFCESSYATSELKSFTVLKYTLDTLTTCFLHDSQQFFANKEAFDILLDPLINLISNFSVHYYEEIIENHLAVCLSQFAVAAGQNNLWKVINYRLLLKTRDIEAKVRFASLLLLENFYDKLGEKNTFLIPETIPFLSELFEDESFKIQQKLKSIVSIIEDNTGQSFHKFL